MQTKDQPNYYGGNENPYETRKVIDVWNLSFHLSTALKYISRLGKKDDESMELNKIRNYFIFELERVGKASKTTKKQGHLWPGTKYDPISITDAWEITNVDVANLISLMYTLAYWTEFEYTLVIREMHQATLKECIGTVDKMLEK